MEPILHLFFNNPLYKLPYTSPVLALVTATLALSGLCVNAWRSTNTYGSGEESHGEGLDSGMNVLIYGISFILSSLTAAFTCYHVRGLLAVILGAALVFYACATLDDSVESDSMPFGDVLLIVLTSINFALHLWALNATHGWWTSLVPTFNDWQSITLWALEAVAVVMVTRITMKIVHQGIPEMRRLTAARKAFLQNGR